MLSNTIDPLVSVIVPCYNLGQFLEEALESLMKQSYKNWECVLVDNGSVDQTSKIANKFVELDIRFSYFRQENKGVASARNLAIKKSKGKYILPLDSDDKIGSDYIKAAVAVLEAQEDVAIVYCNAELFGESSGKWNLPEFSMKQMLIENLIFCSALYRRIDYDRSGGYDDTMLKGFEDWDFWLRILRSDGKVIRLNEVYFYYRIRKNSRNNSIDLDEQKQIRRKIYNDHLALYQKHISVPDLIFESYLDKIALKGVYDSRELKTGKMVISPIKFIKSFFRK